MRLLRPLGAAGLLPLGAFIFTVCFKAVPSFLGILFTRRAVGAASAGKTARKKHRKHYNDCCFVKHINLLLAQSYKFRAALLFNSSLFMFKLKIYAHKN